MSWLLNLLLSFGAILVIGRLTYHMSKKMRLKPKLQQKKQKLQANIDKLRNELKNAHFNSNLTELDLTEIQHRLQDGKLKPIEILQAYQSKALELHDNGNSGICEFISEAKQQAIDLTLSSDRTSLPLYGIPISIHELCSVGGYDSTFGLIKRCNNPSPADCVLVQVLKSQGAIPFVVTSTTQGGLHLDGYSSIFGNCYNPCSRDHKPGGRACGEAVLIGLKGSPIGFGTDVAGGTRVSASFCGLSALKPTSFRVSNCGLAKLDPTQYLQIRASVDPIGRKTEDLAIVMRAILQSNMSFLDPLIPSLKFDELVYKGLDKPKLRVGFYETFDDLDVVHSVPSIRRGVREAVGILSELGHDVVEFKVPKPDHAFRLALKLLYIHGTSVHRSALYAEPLSEHVSRINISLNMPHFVRLFVDTIMKLILGKPAAISSTLSGPGSLDKALKLIVDAQTYANEFRQAWENAGSLDAVICPIQAIPAPHKSAAVYHTGTSTAYSILYNMLDYPAGIIRITHVNESDIRESQELGINSTDHSVSRVQKEIYKLQETTIGLPVGVQVVARPFQEEIVLRVMRELESRISD